MSHFTTIQVQIKDGQILRETLEELGFQVQCNTSVRGYLWNRTKADYVIRQKNGFDLGFRLNGDHYELVSDFWGARIDQKSFLDQIMQKYAHKSLVANAKQQGYTIETEECMEDGSIRVVLGRWV
jgi:hypothetical protein